jgi:hypothetical protein
VSTTHVDEFTRVDDYYDALFALLLLSTPSQQEQAEASAAAGGHSGVVVVGGLHHHHQQQQQHGLTPDAQAAVWSFLLSVPPQVRKGRQSHLYIDSPIYMCLLYTDSLHAR